MIENNRDNTKHTDNIITKTIPYYTKQDQTGLTSKRDSSEGVEEIQGTQSVS